MTGAARQRSGRTRRGFTLLEVIVAVGIVVILLSILLPTLGGARSKAQLIGQSGAMRSLTQTIYAYAGDWDDVYPMADTRPSYIIPSYGPGLVPEPEVDRSTVGRMWHEAIVDAGMATASELEDPDSYNILNSVLSKTLMHAPSLFVPGSVLPYGERVVVPVRTTDVLHPGRKGIMRPRGDTANDPGIAWCCVDAIRGPVAFADTSVTVMTWQDFPPPKYPMIGDIGRPVTATWHGVRGIDR
ncbi:MAG: type II secretion system protein [Phycisphaerales bacterium]